MTERQPGVWRLRVYAARDVDGGRRETSRTFRGSAEDARLELEALVAELEAEMAAISGVTVSELLEHWLDSVVDYRIESTMQQYFRCIDDLVGPALGRYLLGDLTTADVDAAYALWSSEGVGARSVRRAHSILDSALRQAVDWQWLDANPAEAATPPPAAGRTTLRLVRARTEPGVGPSAAGLSAAGRSEITSPQGRAAPEGTGPADVGERVAARFVRRPSGGPEGGPQPGADADDPGTTPTTAPGVEDDHSHTGSAGVVAPWTDEPPLPAGSRTSTGIPRPVATPPPPPAP